MKYRFQLFFLFLLLLSPGVVMEYSSNIPNIPFIDSTIVDINGTGNYKTIQEAINNANPYDIIYIYNGTYEENIDISIPITIIGNGSSTIIQPKSNIKIININIESDNVFISDIYINSSNHANNININIINSVNVTLKGIKVIDGKYGIKVRDSKDVLINNSMFLNQYSASIEIKKGSNISIYNNILSSEKLACGLYVSEVDCINIINNSLYNMNITLIYLQDIENRSINIMKTTINNKQIIILKNLSDVTINRDFSQLFIVNCNNIKIEYTDYINVNNIINIYNSENISISNSLFTFKNSFLQIISSKNILIKNITLENSISPIVMANSNNIEMDYINTNDIEGNILSLININNITINNSSLFTVNNSHGERTSIQMYKCTGISLIDSQIRNSTYGILGLLSHKCTLHNTSFYNNNNSIYYNNVNNINISTCTFQNNSDTVLIYDSDNIKINKCYINSSVNAIQITNLNNITIQNTSIMNIINNGVLISSSSQIYFQYSLISLCSDSGIAAYNSEDIGISYNNIKDNNKGLILYNCDRSQIWCNLFINNTDQAHDDNSNQWYKNYPLGGNFWSDYIGEDKKRGSQQNNIGSDGFGDIPYHINGGNSRDIYPIYIDNVPPVSNAGKDVVINQGDVFFFSAEESYDDQMITEYCWNFIYNGIQYYYNTSDFFFSFKHAGVYNVTLTVFDFNDNYDIDFIIIYVNDIEPPKIIHQGNITIYQNETAYFNASQTNDNINISEILWKFKYKERNISLYGDCTEFIFNVPGYYNISVYVTDDNNNTANSNFQLIVIDIQEPIAIINGYYEYQNGERVNLTSLNSYDNGIIISREWSFIYNDNLVLYRGHKLEYYFDIPGYYKVILKVVDQFNNSDSLEVQIVIIDTIIPNPIISGKLYTTNLSIKLSAEESFDNGIITNYSWEITNNTHIYQYGRIITINFNKRGHYNVVLTIWDEWNNSNSTEAEIVIVDNNKPIILLDSYNYLPLNCMYIFNSRQSYDDGIIVNYSWEFSYDENNYILYSNYTSFIFMIEGIYRIKHKVIDQDDNINEKIILINVTKNGWVTGNIFNRDLNILEKVKIELITNGTKYICYTDENGYFNISIPCGNVHYKIIKNGYKTYTGVIKVRILNETYIMDKIIILNGEENKHINNIYVIMSVFLLIIIAVTLVIIKLILYRRADTEE